ncbi:bifunctional PIG-L family deacetylase/class I SAM-dependent methyltransferase [Microbacteriaceae bacterium VKM Ac-2854]|nr:bifunctional PIG-L family deacetylase/class I SAM-dependent methyltransferase [Microbacteriaceae bacterium VKM Ac-2854]
MAGFDATRTVTPAAAWRADPRWSDARALAADAFSSGVIVFAAHPDDETLGVGGLLAGLADAGVGIHLVLATSGHDAASTAVRRGEAIAALRILAPDATVEFYGLPDAGLKDVEPALGAAVERTLGRFPARSVLVTWQGDRHGDHRRLAEAVRGAVTGTAAGSTSGTAAGTAAGNTAGIARRVLEYPIWLWQWGTGGDVPWSRARTFALSAAARARKAAALAAYSSQITGAAPVLVPAFLEHFDSSREILFLPEDLPENPTATRFDELHRVADPWGFTTRWYERRKRAVTLAALTRERYRSALEVGCSIGVLSVELAQRSDELLAVDIAPRAVAAASERLRPMPHARAEARDAAAAWPAGEHDLIVLSEVGYYLDPEAWLRIALRVGRELPADGEVVLCHWLHPEPDFRQQPELVHRSFAAASGLTRVIEHREADFLLEVYRRD